MKTNNNGGNDWRKHLAEVSPIQPKAVPSRAKADGLNWPEFVAERQAAANEPTQRGKN